jgi:hypothetical protein
MKRTTRTIFEDELSRREIAFERSDEGTYRLQVDGGTIVASLENIRRNAERDNDPEAVRRFVDHLVRALPDAFAASLRNQDTLLERVNLEVEEVDGHKLGMVPLDSPYKASVIFAGSFRDLVAQTWDGLCWL